MNNHYKKLLAILATLMDEPLDWNNFVLEALREAKLTSYSKSRVQGWRVSPDHKNFRVMQSDELLDVLNAVYRKLNNDA